MATTNRKRKRLQLRLDPDLHAALKDSAESNLRSFNQEANYLLRAALECPPAMAVAAVEDLSADEARVIELYRQLGGKRRQAWLDLMVNTGQTT